MAEDVRNWCRRCRHCQSERGVPGVSAWTRTELYSRPFRVIQIDTVHCRDREDAGGARYIPTVIDCFSRYPWLIPIRENKSSEIADCLMRHVFLGESMFPVVIRSDNGPEYMGDIIKELNKLLGITHILSLIHI